MTMKLSRYNLKNITSEKVALPDEEIFELPEKVLQFGTGVLLRGLPDYFIDAANKVGIFNGTYSCGEIHFKGRYHCI